MHRESINYRYVWDVSGADSKQGESALGRRRGGENIVCWKKGGVGKRGGCTPPYIGQGGCHPPPLPHVGLNPQGGEVRRPRGMSPTPWRQAQGGETPSSPNGPIWPIKPFSTF